jgi:hypothetical protein
MRSCAATFPKLGIFVGRLLAFSRRLGRRVSGALMLSLLRLEFGYHELAELKRKLGKS